MKHNPHNPWNIDCSKLSKEEIEERLREHGFPVGEWHVEEDQNKGPKKFQLTAFKSYAELLTQMQGVIEMQVKQDLKEIDSLHVKLQKMKQGGGA